MGAGLFDAAGLVLPGIRSLRFISTITAMALLLFFLVMPAFTFLFQPMASLYSRKHEFEADEYAARNASATDLMRALVKLYQDNAQRLPLIPLHSAFYDSHPPAAMRIARLQKPGAKLTFLNLGAPITFFLQPAGVTNEQYRSTLCPPRSADPVKAACRRSPR